MARCFPNAVSFHDTLSTGPYDDCTVLETFNCVQELILPNVDFSQLNQLHSNFNLKHLVFSDFKLNRYEEIVRNYPNVEKIAFKIYTTNFFTSDENTMEVINALQILIDGLKQLKLLACTEASDRNKIPLSLNDVINITKNAENLEFLLMRAKIDDFDAIYKHFAPKFDVVRYNNEFLLMSQKKILESVKNEKNRSMKKFEDIHEILSNNFFKGLD